MSQMKIEENQIPALIKAGKENEVIELLYKLLFPKVKSFIIKHNGRKEDASDVFQDAVLYFYKQVIENKFNDKYTVYGYVYKLSINRWINKIKKDKKLLLPGELLENYQEPEFENLDDLKSNKELIEKLLNEVGEKCKEILSYTIFYDLMMEDIMLRMGFASEGAVKMQLKRCKEKLYKIVEDNASLLKNMRRE